MHRPCSCVPHQGWLLLKLLHQLLGALRQRHTQVGCAPSSTCCRCCGCSQALAARACALNVLGFCTSYKAIAFKRS